MAGGEEMKIIYDFEFDCQEIIDYQAEIKLHTEALINKTIRLNSPIQKDDIVDVDGRMLKVKYIDLLIGGKKWVYGDAHSDGKFSFSYWGIPLKRDGKTEMKKRKLINFWYFVKDGTEYHMPSYCRRVIVPPQLDKGCEYYSSYDGQEVRPKGFWR
jgi:hypothetical protein